MPVVAAMLVLVPVLVLVLVLVLAGCPGSRVERRGCPHAHTSMHVRVRVVTLLPL